MANNKKKVAANNNLLVANCDVQEMIIRTGSVHPRNQEELFDKNSCCCTRGKSIRTISLNQSTTVVHYTVQERIMINSTGAMHPFAQAELFS